MSNENFLFNVFETRTFFRDFFYFSNCKKVQIIIALLLLFISVLVIIHQVICPVISFFIKKKKGNDISRRILRGYAAGTFFLGWFVYLIGFCEEGTSKSILALTFRSLLSSMEQFVFHSDLLEVSEICHDSAWFMTLYTMTYLSAVIVSSIVIVNCIKDRLSFSVKCLVWSVVRCRTIYVFFGVNNRNLVLARNISEEIKKHNKKERIVLVSFPKEYTDEHGHTSLSKVFGLRSLDKQKVQLIRSLQGVLISASSELFNDAAGSGMSSNVLEQNGLGKLIGLLYKADSVKLFFLSENENENIRAGINIEHSHALHDKHERQYHGSVEIYCKARRSYENYVLIDHSRYAEFHLVDDSSLAVHSLMTSKDDSGIFIAHPINYVKINSTLGIVESKFTCMIIGFGQTGQDTMKFLYEFGSFVGKDRKKSPFHCRVIDKNMEQHLGYIAREIPALQLPDETSSTKLITKEEIELMKCDIHTVEFWKSLEEKAETGSSFIQDVNCIVVAIGSDEENIALAAQLYEFATRHDAINNKERGLLRIFVRTYDMEEQERVRMIENYYRDEQDVIRLFGKIEDIYSYKNIVKNEMLEDAKKFYDSYNAVTGNQQSWDDRHRKLIDGTMSERNAVRIKEAQDCSNVLHQFTKQQLLGLKSLSIWPLPSNYPFISNAELEKIASKKYGDMPEEDKEIKLWFARLQNVSHCEHLRWNASFYMNGFIRNGDNKDFRLRQHPCLVGWDETSKDGVALLSDDTKKYDYQVVETTIIIWQNQQPAQNDNCIPE